MRLRSITRRAGWPALLVLIILPAAAAGQPYDWTGAGANSRWSNSDNWIGGSPPTSAATTQVFFDVPGNQSPFQDIAGPFVLNRVTFFVSSGPVTLTGGPLQFVANGGTQPQVLQYRDLPMGLGDVVLGASLDFAGTGNGTVTVGRITASGFGGGIVQDGPYALVLTSVNSPLNFMDVNAGSVRFTSNDALTSDHPVPVTLATGGTLDLNDTYQKVAFVSGSGAVAFGSAGTGTLVVGIDNSDSTFAGRLTGSGTLIKTGTGTLTLSGANSHTLTRVEGGTLQLGSATALPAGGAVTLVAGTLDLNGFSTTIGPLTLGGGSASVTNSDIFHTPQLTLAGDITYLGGSSPAATILVPKVDLGGATRTVAGTAGARGPGNVDLIIRATLTGAGGLTVSHAGSGGTFRVQLLLYDPNKTSTFSGAATVNSGCELYPGTDTLPSTAAVVLNGGSLVLADPATRVAHSLTIGSLAGAGTVDLGMGDSHGNPVALAVGLNNSDTTFGGGLAGLGGLEKKGTGTLTLTGASICSIAPIISGGTLRVADDSSFCSATAPVPTVILNGGTLGSVSNLGTSRPFNVTAAGGGFDVPAGGVMTLTGPVSGSGTLTKTGAGRLTVSNVTLTGGATVEVNAGTLANQGLIGSAAGGLVNVNAGTVIGAGSYAGGLSVNRGGRFSPGLAVGMATSASTTWGAGGTFEFDLADATGTAGSGWDKLGVTGGLTVAAGTNPADRFVIDITSLTGPNGPPGLTLHFDPAQNYRWLFADTNGVTGFDASKFLVTSSAFANPTAGGSFGVLAQGNQLFVTFTPVPEPGGGLLAVLAAAAAGGVVRRTGIRGWK